MQVYIKCNCKVVKKLYWFENLSPVIQAMIATTFTWGITALGALVVYFFKEVNKKVLNTILGFSAGVMLAASFWSLIEPAIDLSEKLGYIAWLPPAIGFIVGGLFVILSDRFLDKVLKNKKINRKVCNNTKKNNCFLQLCRNINVCLCKIIAMVRVLL